ncbi:MAG: isomerase, partial [Deltaproteobacteria bacterium]
MEYVFEPERLHECVRQGIGLPVGEAFDRITEALSRAYPRRIQTGERRWHMNNAGGAMGQMTLLYASMREYII